MSEVYAAHPDAVPQWREVLAPRGGSWMVLSRRSDALIVSPPAVPLCPGEGPDVQGKWRLATWPLDAHGWITPSPDITPVAVRTAEVLLILPPTKHPWVEAIMQAQLAQCEAFVAGRPKRLADEAAISALAELRSELRAAFPDRDWHSDSEAELPNVPATVGELLKAIGHGGAATHDVAAETSCYELAVDDLLRQLSTWRTNATRVLAEDAPWCPATSRVHEVARSLLKHALSQRPTCGPAEHREQLLAHPGFARALLDAELFYTTISTSSFGSQDRPDLAVALAAWRKSSGGSLCRLGGRVAPQEDDLRIAGFIEQAIVEIPTTSDDAPMLAFLGHGSLGLTVSPSPPSGALVDIPGWAALTRSIAGDAVMLVDACASPGDGQGLNKHLLYRCGLRPHRDCSALMVQDAMERRSCYAGEMLTDEWAPLTIPRVGSELSNHELDLVVFRGSVVDQRTHEKGRLVVFRSLGGTCYYVVVPHSANGDVLPYLEIDGAHAAERRALSELARAATDRRRRPALSPKARLYAEHLKTTTDKGSDRLAFAVAANVSHRA